MAMQMVAEVDEPDATQRLKLVPTTADEPAAEQPATRPTPHARPVVQYPTEAILAVIDTLARALALRVLLFIGFIVASVLGYLVIADPTWMKLAALAGWAVLIYIPVVSLNARQR